MAIAAQTRQEPPSKGILLGMLEAMEGSQLECGNCCVGTLEKVSETKKLQADDPTEPSLIETWSLDQGAVSFLSIFAISAWGHEVLAIDGLFA